MKGILQKVKEHISVAPIFARLKTTPHKSEVQQNLNLNSHLDSHSAGLGIVHRLVESIKPQPKLDFDGYQQQFPPKSFPSPKQTWYNIPTKDDGSHSWPFSETWPPEFFVDLRCHVPLFGTMFLAVTLPILLVQCFAYPATQQIGNRPGYDCMYVLPRPSLF